MQIIITLQEWKLKTSTRHHHFLSQILNQIYFYYLHLPIPLKVAILLEFVKIQRGKPKLKHEGYLYCLLREKHGLKTRRCDKRHCKAIATTFEDNVFTTREHLLEPDMKHSEQLKVLKRWKRRPRTPTGSQEKLSSIQQQLLSVSVQWHCRNTRAWPEAFKGNVGGEITRRHWSCFLSHIRNVKIQLVNH